MAKTLVAAKHHSNPGARNGDGGCHGRWANDDGSCPGVKLAEWLNGLGDDDAPYYSDAGFARKAGDTTCGMVRDNWLRGSDHIVAVEPRLAQLNAERRRCEANLRYVKREIKRIQAAS